MSWNYARHCLIGNHTHSRSILGIIVHAIASYNFLLFNIPKSDSIRCVHVITYLLLLIIYKFHVRWGCRSRDIDVLKVDFFRSFTVFKDIDIPASTPPTDMKFAPSVYFQECYAMTLSFIKGGYTKKI